MTTQTARKSTKKASQPPTSLDAQGQPVKAGKLATDAETGKSRRTKSVSNADRSASATAKGIAGDGAENGKLKRAKKEKVVRDSFTMPKADYERIALLKRKCLEAGVAVKKSELLRAGLQLLESAPSKRLLAAISALETVKTGRPAKGA